MRSQEWEYSGHVPVTLLVCMPACLPACLLYDRGATGTVPSGDAVPAECVYCSTACLSCWMASEGLGAPNTELPATMQLAPASAAAEMVEGERPPST